MKSHVWVKHSNLGETVEITVRDFSGARLESWKISGLDKKRQKQIFSAIKKKYDIDLFFYKLDRDLSWAG